MALGIEQTTRPRGPQSYIDYIDAYIHYGQESLTGPGTNES